MEKEKDSNSGKGTVLWLFFVLVLLIIIWGCISLFQKKNFKNVANAEVSYADSEGTETQPSSEEIVTEPVTEANKIVRADFSGLEINSETALLADLEGNEYFAQNQYERIYPASLTKIMTAIVALEKVYDIDEKIIITGDIYDQVNAENGSTAGFLPYEEVSYRDLLNGALLSSGAECCLTLANYIAGCEWNYVDLMNDKAAELGMNDTHFTNVCGFQNYDHYSTAADISLLLKYALENDTFYEIFTSQSYYTETDEHPSGITLTSTMFSAMDSSSIKGGKILGGKTGFTDEAGLCLASAAEIDGKIYTLITTGAPGSHDTEPLHIDDAINIYERLSQ